MLEERALGAMQRAAELSSELEATGASLGDARQEIRALQRELSATKSDASQMVKVRAPGLRVRQYHRFWTFASSLASVRRSSLLWSSSRLPLRAVRLISAVQKMQQRGRSRLPLLSEIKQQPKSPKREGKDT